MLRPERMSKVSVTGSQRVMPSVIETVHELSVLHLSDYDGSWSGFDNGDPIEGADEIAERLVTVRALESALALEEGVADPGELPSDWEGRLEEVRSTVTGLDDDRTETREELRQLEERIDRVGPFADLGIDLDLLSGYRSVDVSVGHGTVADVEDALEDADVVRAWETFSEDDVVAIVAAPGEETDTPIDDALVGVEFTALEIPEAVGDPSSHLETLEEDHEKLTSTLEEIEEELAAIADREGQFLRRVETELTARLNRAEAPLQFATTERAFVAEGWIPTETVEEFRTVLEEAVGDALEIQELERADYDRHGAPTHTAAVSEAEDTDGDSEPQAARAATDGGTGEVVTMDDDPPVVLNNLTPAKPFEMMVKMVNQPKYSELDPTLLIFLTYPFAFGFMIGDIGYGILYMLMGYAGWKVFDSDAGKALGTIGIWAGVFTIIFGYLYDDIFGIHMSDVGLGFLPYAGALDKGLQATEWALLWIVASILFGILHLNVGLVMGFINELRHSLTAAVYEKLSWIFAMNGLFLWIFAHSEGGSFDHGIGFLPDDLAASGMKPEFLVGTHDESVLYEAVGFAGLPEVVGIAGLIMLFVGATLVGVGEGIAGIFEIPAWAFGHVLSYLRLVAVLLAKGGMAFAVNLLVFGAYVTDAGYVYFNYPGLAIEDISGTESYMLTEEFVGLIHVGDGLLALVGILAAILVFVLGHILVLLLGITAAGIQMLRLEYVEFFQKFYEGGGEEYDPFGGETQAAAEST